MDGFLGFLAGGLIFTTVDVLGSEWVTAHPDPAPYVIIGVPVLVGVAMGLSNLRFRAGRVAGRSHAREKEALEIARFNEEWIVWTATSSPGEVSAEIAFVADGD